MKWIKNLELLAIENKTGVCPHCGSENTDCSFVVVNNDTRMGHGAIWCEDCRRAFHISRITVLDGMKTGIPPNDLIY